MKHGFFLRCSAALLFSFVIVSVFAQQIAEVPALPDWKLPQQLQLVVAKPDTILNWNLAPRIVSESEPTASVYPQCAGALLPIVKNQPVRVTVKSERGFPVVMITDGPIHQLDRLFLQMTESMGKKSFPGNPVAFAIGRDNSATVSVLPPYDGIWQVWVWILPKKLKVQDIGTIDEEALEMWSEGGITPEQAQRIMLLMGEGILRAW